MNWSRNENDRDEIAIKNRESGRSPPLMGSNCAHLREVTGLLPVSRFDGRNWLIEERWGEGVLKEITDCKSLPPRNRRRRDHLGAFDFLVFRGPASLNIRSGDECDCYECKMSSSRERTVIEGS
ncbi:hypothetical protein EVAR_9792_1 [Eumeta japonica]|uniref:Uncharacterized protein n=1 Tax=Eumeta variegata TaxID=151549 RepID=A0A4C1U664_EUMVA|nr:hypothetical protein EVAR_9792_1 [Eumeta japonica]